MYCSIKFYIVLYLLNVMTKMLVFYFRKTHEDCMLEKKSLSG